MVLRFLLLVGTFILASCVSIERNNPDDPGGINFQAGSSSLGGSSNSVAYVSKGKDITKYKTVTIGDQVWMAENLDNDVSGSRCYDNNSANCAIYGRLYYWEIARTACPDGWHLPNYEDWNILMKYVNPNCSDINVDTSYNTITCAGAGKLLKATSGWADCVGTSEFHGSKGNGTDDFGFAALPGGIGDRVTWLSSDLVDNWRELVSGLQIYLCGDDASFYTGISMTEWYSVRCVKDGGSHQPSIVYGSPVTYEGETYKTVVIGTQTWMAENLNYRGTEPDTLGRCYEDNPTYCTTYGRLYSWETAKSVCPSGWHLPSDTEWAKLTSFVGGSTADRYLKATDGWNSNCNGEDMYGFSALPGGSGYDGSFELVGTYGNWWSSTEKTDSTAYSRSIYSSCTFAGVTRGKGGYKTSLLYSVRCVKD